MNEYELLAGGVWEKVHKVLKEQTDIDAETTTIPITLKELIHIYDALMAMGRIKKIANSQYGGAEYFR